MHSLSSGSLGSLGSLGRGLGWPWDDCPEGQEPKALEEGCTPKVSQWGPILQVDRSAACPPGTAPNYTDSGCHPIDANDTQVKRCAAEGKSYDFYSMQCVESGVYTNTTAVVTPAPTPSGTVVTSPPAPLQPGVAKKVLQTFTKPAVAPPGQPDQGGVDIDWGNVAAAGIGVGLLIGLGIYIKKRRH